MIQWEYKVIEGSAEISVEKANEEGKDSWEMCAFRGSGGMLGWYIYWFKRPIQTNNIEHGTEDKC